MLDLHEKGRSSNHESESLSHELKMAEGSHRATKADVDRLEAARQALADKLAGAMQSKETAALEMSKQLDVHSETIRTLEARLAEALAALKRAQTVDIPALEKEVKRVAAECKTLRETLESQQTEATMRESRFEQEKIKRAEEQTLELRKSFGQRTEEMVAERIAALAAVEAHRDQLKTALATQKEVVRQLNKEIASMEESHHQNMERSRKERVELSNDANKLKAEMVTERARSFAVEAKLVDETNRREEADVARGEAMDEVLALKSSEALAEVREEGQRKGKEMCVCVSVCVRVCPCVCAGVCVMLLDRVDVRPPPLNCHEIRKRADVGCSGIAQTSSGGAGNGRTNGRGRAVGSSR